MRPGLEEYAVPITLHRRSTLFAFLAATPFAVAIAGEEPKPEVAEFRVDVSAPIDDLKRAISERAAFDGVSVGWVADAPAALLRRAGAPFDQWDPIVQQIRTLDAALAEAARLRRLTDDELKAAFDKACVVPPAGTFGGALDRYPILLEIVRRGGETWRDRVRDHLAKLEDWRATTDADDDGTRSWDAHDLEPLTALRRLEKMPDPVRMEVESPETCVYPDLPTVGVVMTVCDDRPVTLTRGGDYRSGRELRYHVEARGADGRLCAGVVWSHFGMGGGMFARERRSKGESLRTSLPLAKYVARLDPGEYRLRVHYSDWGGISDPDEFLGSVTVASEPFTIRVLPRVVLSSASAQRRLAGWAEELPTEGTVHVLADDYGEWAHGFVPPDSAAGKLAAAGWEAVPALVQFARRPEADAVRRAWAFSLLYGITGRLDPTSARVIGDCETHEGGMRKVTGGGFVQSSTRRTSPHGRAIDRAAQDEFARAWEKLAALVELKLEK